SFNSNPFRSSFQVASCTMGCANYRATVFETDESFWRRSWDNCAAGALEFVLHPGAHGVPRGWSDMALDWFEAELAK
ncbi:MAG: hypothetical protein OXC60_07545, partial [Litoreibacter sp.]|nr:hypothetical protein [Litoreibacter sp.]